MAGVVETVVVEQAACVQFGGDFAFGSAVWQFADAHSQHAPTYVYRYDYAPRTLKWTGVAPWIDRSGTRLTNPAAPATPTANTARRCRSTTAA